MSAEKESVEIIDQREPGWEEAVQIRLGQLEKDVLEKKVLCCPHETLSLT